MSDQEASKSRWSETRDLFAAAREAMIVIAIVFVLVAPSVVRGWLQRAGITSIAGVEFSIEEVVDASQQVAIAEAQVAKLSEQLAVVEAKLASLSTATHPAHPDAIREITSAVHSLRRQAASANDSLSETSRKFDRAVKLMPPEKLRELVERNALEQSTVPSEGQPTPVQVGTITIPDLQSARLQGLRLPPMRTTGDTTTR